MYEIKNQNALILYKVYKIIFFNRFAARIYIYIFLIFYLFLKKVSKTSLVSALENFEKRRRIFIYFGQQPKCTFLFRIRVFIYFNVRKILYIFWQNYRERNTCQPTKHIIAVHKGVVQSSGISSDNRPLDDRDWAEVVVCSVWKE